MTVTGEFAASQISRLIRNLTTQIRKTLRTPDADAVHDLRVSIRRFDQALILFGELLGEKHIRKARRRLKRLMTLAGEVRDFDIAEQLLVPGFTPAEEKIGCQRETARRALATELRCWVAGRCSSKLAGWLRAAGPGPDIRIRLRHVTREFLKCGAGAVRSGSPAALHRFRIAAKHHRYTLELLAPIVGRRMATRHLTVVKAVQSRLGNVNDCETVRVMATNWGLGRDVDAFLKKRERRQMERFKDEWRARFSDSTQERRWVDELPATKNGVHAG